MMRDALTKANQKRDLHTIGEKIPSPVKLNQWLNRLDQEKVLFESKRVPSAKQKPPLQVKWEALETSSTWLWGTTRKKGISDAPMRIDANPRMCHSKSILTINSERRHWKQSGICFIVGPFFVVFFFPSSTFGNWILRWKGFCPEYSVEGADFIIDVWGLRDGDGVDSADMFYHKYGYRLDFLQNNNNNNLFKP